MKNERIYAEIGAADDELPLRCEAAKLKKTKTWVKYGGLAACLCLIIFAAYFVLLPALSETSSRPVLQWSEQFSAEDYFKYNNSSGDGTSSSGSDFLSIIAPYAESRSFSGARSQLEAEGIIPVMADHPMFYCDVNYNEDGSIYSIVFLWGSRGGSHYAGYSHLTITAGYQEVRTNSDHISIEVDNSGNIVKPAVTVVLRDGVQIVAEGNENSAKTITFQNESGWYQIEGSGDDSYMSLVMLLDWIWAHPIDFGRFPIDIGDSFTWCSLDEMPDAFSGYIPDFAKFGFITSSGVLTLKNEIPYYFEGQYYIGSVAERRKNIDWCVFTNPDYYYHEWSLGELHELTEEMVLSQIDPERRYSHVVFAWDDLLIFVYSNTAQDVWAIIQSIM